MGIEGVSNTQQIKSIERVKEKNPLSEQGLQDRNKEDVVKAEESQDAISKKNLEKEIDGVNQLLKTSQTTVKFQLHDKLQEYYVQIVDKNTEEVIREIPARKFLDMYANIMEQIGLLVDHRI